MTYHGPETRSRIPAIKHHGPYHGYHAPSYHGFPLSYKERGTVEVERGLPMRHPTAPDATVTRAMPNPQYPGHYIVSIHCPYCLKSHTHGWAGPGDPGGHRTAHCADAPARERAGKGYNLVIPEGLEVRT